jgi:Rrf2 family protein
MLAAQGGYMNLSTRGRYGTRLVLELSKQYGKGPLSVSQISKSQSIPEKYLEQLIIPLKRAQLIKSVRGPKGGHMLAEPPEKISVWDIVRLLEAKFSFVDCLNDPDACKHAGDCPVRPVWGKAYQAMINVFKETTLEDLIRAPGLLEEMGSRDDEQ